MKTYGYRSVIRSFDINYSAGSSIRSQRPKEKNPVYRVARERKLLENCMAGERGPCPVSAQRRSGAGVGRYEGAEGLRERGIYECFSGRSIVKLEK